jgi:flagellar capping protein FliD
MSGLDTNAIIAGLIDLKRIPIQQLESRRAGYEAKDSAWQAINTCLSAVRPALNAIDTAADFNELVTATSSNEAAVVATPSGSANPGSLAFTVDRLATTHRMGSTASFAGASAAVGAGDFTITVGGTTTSSPPSSFGSSASFEVVGDPFGLAGTHAGTDAAGTIGGEAATGSGRMVTAADRAGAILDLGQVSYDQGMFGALEPSCGYRAVANESDTRSVAASRVEDVSPTEADTDGPVGSSTAVPASSTAPSL